VNAFLQSYGEKKKYEETEKGGKAHCAVRWNSISKTRDDPKSCKRKTGPGSEEIEGSTGLLYKKGGGGGSLPKGNLGSIIIRRRE